MNRLILFKHKIIEKVRCFYLVNFNSRYKANMQRYKSSLNKKSKVIIKSEIKELKKYWGCFPLQYFNHDFYSKDCTLTMNEMKLFIPSYYFYRIIFPQYDDSKALLNIVEDKIVMDTLFKGMDFPSANVIIKKKSNYLFNPLGDALTAESFLESLQKSDSNKLFIKPVNGRGGNGILVAKKRDDIFYIKDDEFNYNYLINLQGDYVIEEAILQHDAITAVYPHSVNTLRVITKRNKAGAIEIVAITLRMGSKGREIDNTSAGGLVIGINLLTGLTVREYATQEYGLERFYEHPDSGFKFKQLKIPNWLAVKSQVIELANKNIIMNLTGWDIAITQNGILVIEINTLFGIDGLQSSLGGLRDKFDENYTVQL
ncbi:sugar-transfer associated ATP-grasp domain-containing protein [Pseudoalteromonas sp. 3-MNA-CIBAN-0064]|uniref:sugar-transfer associated ATP-grasp domain-containing protein n=1 Tax=unclassified Pseudoalteromonas TaxID=194690 RepID=UPI0033180FB4